jgi:hypothetical protein
MQACDADLSAVLARLQSQLVRDVAGHKAALAFAEAWKVQGAAAWAAEGLDREEEEEGEGGADANGGAAAAERFQKVRLRVWAEWRQRRGRGGADASSGGAAAAELLQSVSVRDMHEDTL